MEGTDAVIKRAGELARGKLTVIKVAKPNQDMRFDVPVIGTETVRIATDAKIRAIAVEAGRTLLLEKAALIDLAERSKITLIGQL